MRACVKNKKSPPTKNKERERETERKNAPASRISFLHSRLGLALGRERQALAPSATHFPETLHRGAQGLEADVRQPSVSARSPSGSLHPCFTPLLSLIFSSDWFSCLNTYPRPVLTPVMDSASPWDSSCQAHPELLGVGEGAQWWKLPCVFGAGGWGMPFQILEAAHGQQALSHWGLSGSVTENRFHSEQEDVMAVDCSSLRDGESES